MIHKTPAARKGLRLALYVGWHRWCDWRRGDDGRPDIAEALLEAVRQSGHTVAALILRPGDRLEKWARRLRAPLLGLPGILALPLRDIRRRLEGGAWQKDRELRRWVAALEAARPDLGFVYCGGWIPPPLAAVPRMGFINYHPAPLPNLPGYFPEYFLTLWGRARARGTVHRVSESFDSGPILAYTPLVRLPRRTTPADVGSRMLSGGLGTAISVIDRLAAGRPAPPLPAAEQADGKGLPFSANLANINKETRLRWDADDHAALARRLRCFGSVPWERCHPLHARVGGEDRRVLGMELHRGDFPGRPGALIGVYRGAGPFDGASLIRTREGLAVVAAGEPFGPDQRLSQPAEWIARPGRRRRRTAPKGFSLAPGIH